VFDVHVSEEERMQILVKEAMEKAIKLVVPMEVEWKIAQNWLEAH
jgi:DNA polymerase-1